MYRTLHGKGRGVGAGVPYAIVSHLEQVFVVLGEGSAVEFVDELRDADDAAGRVADGHTQDAACAEPRLVNLRTNTHLTTAPSRNHDGKPHRWVKAVVFVSIWYVNALKSSRKCTFN